MTPVKRLLLIDDDYDDCFFFRTAAKSTGFPFELFHEADCETAIKKLSDESLPAPDLLFLDWHMPKMDGADGLKKIRNISACSKIPIILLTGSIDPVIREIAIQFNVSFVLFKTWDLNELTKELVTIFSKHGSDK